LSKSDPSLAYKYRKATHDTGPKASGFFVEQGRLRTSGRIDDATRDLTPTASQLTADAGIFNPYPKDHGYEKNDQSILDQPLTIFLD
jgi:hypothetical protein